MKLLVITMLYEPDCVGIAAIATDMCHGLAERGHDVTVYTTYPYYPEWTLKSNVNPWCIAEESLANVRIRRHGLFIPGHPSRLIPRLLHELSFPVSLLRSLFDRRRYDIVMVFCPLLGSVAFAGVRKWFHREPLWVNVQDIPADAGRATGINNSHTIHLLGSLAQRLLFGCGEIWSSISPDMVARLKAFKPKRSAIHLCPNWLVGTLARQIGQLPSKIGRPVERPMRLLYCGTIGKKQALLRFCEQLAAFDVDFRFRIRGAGGEADAVSAWIKQQGDKRFQFGPLLPDAEFVRAIHDTDWFVITEMQGAGPSFLSSKLIPCISLATPILAVSDRTSPLGREVKDHKLGIAIEWSELDHLPGRLNHFLDVPSEFTALQRQCADRARDYDRTKALDRMEVLLRQAILEPSVFAPCVSEGPSTS
jgi:colanic acid biosynthesis glycosyl transferase WcaI